MRHLTPDPAQGALFGVEPAGQAMDPNIRMGDHAYVAANAAVTSEIAAVDALPRTGTQRARVLEVIRRAGPIGMTDEEAATALGLSLNSVRPRRLELVEQGLVLDSGQTRATSTGSPARVWVTPAESWGGR